MPSSSQIDVMIRFPSLGVSHVCISLSVQLSYKSFVIILISSIFSSQASSLMPITTGFRCNDIKLISTLVAPNVLNSYSQI